MINPFDATKSNASTLCTIVMHYFNWISLSFQISVRYFTGAVLVIVYE